MPEDEDFLRKVLPGLENGKVSEEELKRIADIIGIEDISAYRTEFAYSLLAVRVRLYLLTLELERSILSNSVGNIEKGHRE